MGRASCPGGQRGSVIRRSHSLPPPSLAPQPVRAATRRSSEIYSELALGSWRPYPAWSRGSSVDKMSKLFGFQFFPARSRPLGTSSLSPGPLPTKTKGRDRPSSQSKRRTGLGQP